MGYLELPRGTLATPDISYDYFPFTFSARASVLNNINNNNMKYIRELSPNKSGKKKSSRVNKSCKKNSILCRNINFSLPSPTQLL